MSINSSLVTFAKLQDKRDEARFGFIKQILLMASGLLGILVSLHKGNTTCDSARILYGLALGLLSLGILCLAVGLYAQIVLCREKTSRWWVEIQKHIHDENYVEKKLILGSIPKIYSIFEDAGYVSLILSIICLTIYAILIA